MNKKIVIATLVVILVALMTLVFFKSEKTSNNNIASSPTSQTTPTPKNEHVGWKTINDEGQNVSFSYPENLGTIFIRTQTWPPKITVADGSFTCTEEGQTQAGPQVSQKTIGNTTYCVESTTQGAVGTFYTDYTYIFVKDSKLVSLMFTIAYPQCDNYPEPKKTQCAAEKSSFDLDNLIGEIAQTVVFSSNISSSINPTVLFPKPNTKVISPLKIQGTVPAGWMFEGVFPVKLLDSNGNVIGQTQAKEVLAGSWSSGKDVEFSATLDFSTNAQSGSLVLEKDNPSGLPQNAGSFEIPVIF